MICIICCYQECEEENLDLSDDEELSQAFDMHSLIVSSLQSEHEDPVVSADQAITEIECMMRVSYVVLLVSGSIHCTGLDSTMGRALCLGAVDPGTIPCRVIP